MACAVVLFGATAAQAASSDLDSSFGNGGTQPVQPFGTVGGGTPNCCRAAMYPRGKFVVHIAVLQQPDGGGLALHVRRNARHELQCPRPNRGRGDRYVRQRRRQRRPGAVAVDSQRRSVVATTVAISGVGVHGTGADEIDSSVRATRGAAPRVADIQLAARRRCRRVRDRVRTSDNRSFALTLPRRSFTVLAVAARTTARITVGAFDEHGQSPAASLQVRPLQRR